MIAGEVLYKEAVIFLATAALVVPLFMKLRINSIFGFLLVGLLLGPSGLGGWVEQFQFLDLVTIQSQDNISHLAEFGIVFLLFMIGLELSTDRLISMRRFVFGLGGLHVVLSTLALWGIFTLMGWPLVQGYIAASCMALSSTAIVAHILTSQKRLTSNTGRISLSILLFQDIAVIPILLAVEVLAHDAPNSSSLGIVWLLSKALLTIAFVFIMGRIVLRPLLRWAAGSRSPELFMAACLLAILSAGLMSTLSGVSMALGAFIAGLILAETEFRREIEVIMEPFKGLLLGLFFFSVGVSIQLSPILSSPFTLLLMITALLLSKILVMAILGIIFKLPRHAWLESAVLLSPAGEFAFVIVSAAVANQLFNTDQAALILATTTISMIFIPIMPLIARNILRASPTQNLNAHIIEMPEDLIDTQVIIAGYGRVGGLLGSMLSEHKIPYVAVDNDAKLVSHLHAQGVPIYYGDISNPEYLHKIGAGKAKALVITMSSKDKVIQMAQLAKQEFPKLMLIARAHDALEAAKLYDIGVDEAVPETIEASLHLGEAVLVGVGIPTGLVIASIHQRRDDFRKEYQRINTQERTGFLRRQYKLAAHKDTKLD